MMLIYPADVTAPPGPRPDPVDALMDAWHTELPDVLRPTTELSKRIAQLARALDQATRGVLPELGLTVAEFDILVALRRAGEPYRMKPNELARSLLLSSGGISNVVNHLAGRGLVRREPSPDDGRSTMISLTPEGADRRAGRPRQRRRPRGRLRRGLRHVRGRGHPGPARGGHTAQPRPAPPTDRTESQPVLRPRHGTRRGAGPGVRRRVPDRGRPGTPVTRGPSPESGRLGLVGRGPGA